MAFIRMLLEAGVRLDTHKLSPILLLLELFEHNRIVVIILHFTLLTRFIVPIRLTLLIRRPLIPRAIAALRSSFPVLIARWSSRGIIEALYT